MKGAVAVDLGATSARFAVGLLQDGKIHFQIIKQIPHHAIERDGKLFWDLPTLVDLCEEAAEYAAKNYGESTIGIDAWGVDHGFIDSNGRLILDPVCYRDLSHKAAFDELEPYREELYRLTGCQHQPFNTICQLVARRTEDPTLPSRSRWLILPDLIAFLLTGELNSELTEASTTQLLGLDDLWSARAFEIAGWPMPKIQPSLPGKLGAEVKPGIRIAHVGSHDTASAVCGFGGMTKETAFLNVGTWSLLGTVIDQPTATSAAEQAGFTNERAVDGRVRFLKNIPGFYVINRLHEELDVKVSVPEWLAAREDIETRIDLLDPEFYNPDSMLEICTRLADAPPKTEAEWAGLALSSLIEAIARSIVQLEVIAGRTFKKIRVGGGGSQSVDFCQMLADNTSRIVEAGAAESTVLGNLAVQFLAQGVIADFAAMDQIVADSAELRLFYPLPTKS
ncbi:rhamnulokinase family protein [soil metagenome]